jgi:RHS repeat-associated protein
VGQAQTLTFDQANRLTKYTAASNISYGYDGDSLRMCKLAGSSNQPCQAGGNIQFLWDVAGSLPLLLKDGTTSYIYGPRGLPLEQVSGSTSLWYHHDQIGSTRLVTSSTGVSQATYTYDPFGGLASSTGSIINPFRFTGQYQDTESGLYYLRARFYDPIVGQFLSVDPIIGSTRSPYAYVNDAPINRTDPTGQASASGARTDSGSPWNAINDAVGAVLGACDAAGKALQRSASALAAALRAGSSFGGRWLGPVARASRAFEDIPGLGEIAIAASILLGIAAGQSPLEIAGGTIGGVVGGVIGGAVIGGIGCSLGAATTIGDAVICPASIVVGTVVGGYLGGLAGSWVGKSISNGKLAPWSWF